MSETKQEVEERAPAKRAARCVHCSQRDVTVGEPCRYNPDGHQTMDLPAGKTCGDCRHIRRCEAIYGHIPADEICDWFPIRFQQPLARAEGRS